MECVIKIVAGPDAGQEFRCGGLEAIIGRSPRSTVKLTSGLVSYEHAVISRNRTEFFLENLSANGTFVNNERVSGKVKLRAKDQIRIGEETVARVESVPVTAGGGSPRKVMLGVVVAMLVVLGIVVVLDPFAVGNDRNWAGAYAKLQEFTQQEVAAGKLPAATATMLQDAWRWQQAGDKAAATKAWVRLQVLLASTDGENGFQTQSQERRAALSDLLSPDPKKPAPTEDDLAAALVQFVGQMERKK